MKITKQSLIRMLMGCNNGATFASIVAKTTPKMRKTGNPFFGEVVKIARINGCLNFQYDNAVIRRLEKEGKTPDDFTKGESWHTPVVVDGKLTPLCVKKTDPNAFYLRFMLLNPIESVYLSNDGTVIEKEKIDEFLQKSSYDNQGLDNPVIFLTYSVDSIVEIKINGETYNVE